MRRRRRRGRRFISMPNKERLNELPLNYLSRSWCYSGFNPLQPSPNRSYELGKGHAGTETKGGGNMSHLIMIKPPRNLWSSLRVQGSFLGSFFNTVHRWTLPLASVGSPIPFFKVGIVSLQIGLQRVVTEVGGATSWLSRKGCEQQDTPQFNTCHRKADGRATQGSRCGKRRG